MQCAYRMHRGFSAGMAASVILLSAPLSAGAPTHAGAPTECATAQENAEARERSGHLREALESWVACSKAVCGRVLRKECVARAIQVEADLPTIVLQVTDATGAPLKDLAVWMDGELLTSRLDASPLRVDPGLHEFSFRRATSTDGAGAAPPAEGPVLVAKKFLIVQGEHDRPLSVSIDGPHGAAAPASSVPAPPDPSPAAEPSPSPSPSRPPALPFVFGILAGAGTGAALVAAGNKDTSSVATDASIGVSVGALVVATWLFFASRSKHEIASPPAAAYTFDVHPGRSFAFASVSRSF